MNISKSKVVLTLAVILVLAIMPLNAQAAKPTSKEPPLLNGAYRLYEGSWHYVHLEGNSYQVGYQHGYLLWDEVDTNLKDNIGIYWSSESFGDSWYVARDISRLYIWPKLTAEMKVEIEGITAGVRAKGLKWDKWDILALNSWIDVYAYWDVYFNGKGHPTGGHIPLPPPRDKSCSAFIATGTYTVGGEIVVGHNTWSDYASWGDWNVIFDIKPKTGHEIVYQGAGGVIWSGTDWIYNDAGLIVTETTLPGMYVYNPKGIPVFVRERYALQYGSSIDDFINIMTYHCNGAYSNEWLIGDAKTGEICSLQLGCYHWDVKRSFDDFYVSCNYPKGPGVCSETVFNYNNPDTVPYWRNERWKEIVAYYTANKGLIDCELGKAFESDHKDMHTGDVEASMRTLCGHGEAETNLVPPITNWDGSTTYFGEPIDGPIPVGAIDGKVTCSSLVQSEMGMWGRWGHPCGTVFDAGKFLEDNPKYSWQLPYLHDLPDNGIPVPWTEFYANMPP